MWGLGSLHLKGKPVVPVDGIDMTTGATFGFYGPTNKENAMGAVRHDFLVGDTAIKSRDLEPKVFGPDPPPARDDGHALFAAKQLIGDVWLARPKDFFDLQLKPELLDFFTNVTNLWVASDGPGSGKGAFYDIVPFDVTEIYKLIDVLFVNGLTPKPWIE
jgi:hypothetical protein